MIIKHGKRQENVTHNQEKHGNESKLWMTQLLEVADREFNQLL